MRVSSSRQPCLGDWFTTADSFVCTLGHLSPPQLESLRRRRDLEEVYDAVITDPPYGVRAGGRKSVSKPHIVIGDVDSHYPQTDPYPLGECLRDLLDAAAKGLRVGGRLVRCTGHRIHIWLGKSFQERTHGGQHQMWSFKSLRWNTEGARASKSTAGAEVSIPVLSIPDFAAEDVTTGRLHAALMR